MRQIKFLKRCGVYKRGEVALVPNNTAHSLIDGGYAKLYSPQTKRKYKTRQLSAGRGRRYKTK